MITWDIHPLNMPDAQVMVNGVVLSMYMLDIVWWNWCSHRRRWKWSLEERSLWNSQDPWFLVNWYLALIIWAGEILLWFMKVRWGGGWEVETLDWIICIWKTCSWPSPLLSLRIGYPRKEQSFSRSVRPPNVKASKIQKKTKNKKTSPCDEWMPKRQIQNLRKHS